MLPVVHQLVGGTLIIAGLIILPLPIPLGLVMLVVGLALLAPYIPAMQRLIRKMRHKWPNLDQSLRQYRHHFPTIIKKTIDRTHPTVPAE